MNLSYITSMATACYVCEFAHSNFLPHAESHEFTIKARFMTNAVPRYFSASRASTDLKYSNGISTSRFTFALL